MSEHRKYRSERHAKLCAEYADRLIPVLRERARALGYAIGVHGSLTRDIDLIAVPWAPEAVDAKTLAEGIRLAAANEVGSAEEIDHIGADNPTYFFDGCPGAKPHGRLGWAFHLPDGPYIDLSVMPIIPGGWSDKEA